MNIDNTINSLLFISLLIALLCSFYISIKYIFYIKPQNNYSKSNSRLDLFFNTWQFPMLLAMVLDEIVFIYKF